MKKKKSSNDLFQLFKLQLEATNQYHEIQALHHTPTTQTPQHESEIKTVSVLNFLTREGVPHISDSRASCGFADSSLNITIKQHLSYLFRELIPSQNFPPKRSASHEARCARRQANANALRFSLMHLSQKCVILLIRVKISKNTKQLLHNRADQSQLFKCNWEQIPD